jgi:signal transduction histidine kinase
VGAGQFGHRLAIRSSDEIGQLTAALNRMGERLDQHDQERREFLAAVSHELRTPAANIQVTLEALLAGADSEPAMRERFMRAALSESERLSQLVRDLLELARLEAGGVQMAVEPVRLADLVAQASEAMEPRLRDCSVRFAAKSAPDVWVTGDPDRLLQVVMNLLDNAARYTHPECRIAVSVHATSHEAVLRVEDDGPGIPEPDVPFIFDRFYTADKSRARDRSGTGLGLAIVRQIVEAHGGQVEADNVPGAGARFTVRLPRAPAPRDLTRSGLETGWLRSAD